MISNIDAKTLKKRSLFIKPKSVKATINEQSNFDKSKENMDLLQACNNDWNNLYYLRKDRARCIRYKNGDQWSDMVVDEDGKMVKEEIAMSNNGKVPLKHNFIQQFFRNIEGQSLTNPTSSVVYARSKDDSQLSEMLTNTLQACHQLNKTSRIDLSILEELLLCGIGAVKIRYDFWSNKNRPDGRIDMVGINRLFFNTDIEDPRLFDLRRIGEIHDYTLDDLIGTFARSKADEQTLREIYSSAALNNEVYNNRDITKSKPLNSFLISEDINKCRVIEVWEKKGRWVTYVHDYADGTEQVTPLSMTDIDKINAERIVVGQSVGVVEVPLLYAERRYEYYWSVKFLTPTGECILYTETPYNHEEHPYSIAVMPMTDGAVKSVLGDLIDIQRYINRLIVMIDFIMGTSAKGVLLVPEDCIPDGKTVDDFTKEYVKANGVIVYKPEKTTGKIPEQISSNSTNIGAWEMLKLEMNMLQQISGLSGAVQGQRAASNTPSSLYAQEAQNSMLNYIVVFEALKEYQQDRDEKLLKVLMQYYSDKRHVDISGKAYNEVAKYYDPDMVQKIIDFNLVVTQSADTPVFRQATDNVLMDMLSKGFINLEMFLDNTSLPFAEKLKADIKTIKESNMQNIDPNIMNNVAQQAANNADPKALALASQFAG